MTDGGDGLRLQQLAQDAFCGAAFLKLPQHQPAMGFQGLIVVKGQVLLDSVQVGLELLRGEVKKLPGFGQRQWREMWRQGWRGATDREEGARGGPWHGRAQSGHQRPHDGDKGQRASAFRGVGGPRPWCCWEQAADAGRTIREQLWRSAWACAVTNKPRNKPMPARSDLRATIRVHGWS